MKILTSLDRSASPMEFLVERFPQAAWYELSTHTWVGVLRAGNRHGAIWVWWRSSGELWVDPRATLRGRDIRFYDPEIGLTMTELCTGILGRLPSAERWVIAVDEADVGRASVEW